MHRDSRSSYLALVAAFGLVLDARPAAAVITADPAYVVGTIALPGDNQADVAVVGDALAVGQGTFGAGLQSIIRLERDGSSVELVTGLNALGTIVYDAEGDRLLFTDNAGDLVGATTGDTVYALASPGTAAGPVAASTLELLPAGSIPNAQAVLPLPGGDMLIGDAVGPGLGRVVKLSGGTPTDLITGIDYTAGVALALAGNEILVGNVDGTFVGSVQRYSLAGAPLGTLAGGLSGSYDHVVDAAGNLLLTGTFAGDFSSSVLVSIDPSGSVDEIASGWGFSSGLDIDRPTGQLYVLDFGIASIDTLTPIAGMTPGGSGAKECQVESWGAAPDRSGSGKIKSKWTCTDGDPDCDRDATADGDCEMLLGTCFTLTDARVPKCTAAPVQNATASSKRLPAAAAALQAAIAEVVPTSGPVCTRGVPVTLAADKKSVAFKLSAVDLAGKSADKDTLTLRCLPAL